MMMAVSAGQAPAGKGMRREAGRGKVAGPPENGGTLKGSPGFVYAAVMRVARMTCCPLFPTLLHVIC